MGICGTRATLHLGQDSQPVVEVGGEAVQVLNKKRLETQKAQETNLWRNGGRATEPVLIVLLAEPQELIQVGPEGLQLLGVFGLRALESKLLDLLHRAHRQGNAHGTLFVYLILGDGVRLALNQVVQKRKGKEEAQEEESLNPSMSPELTEKPGPLLLLLLPRPLQRDSLRR